MKCYILLPILFLVFSTVYSQNTKNKYIIKQKLLDESYYLRLIPGNSIDSITVSKHGQKIEDRDLFIAYPHNQKIEILKELLSFQGDTTKSDKMYKMKTPDLQRIEVQPFTIQIESLYTFSRMLLLGFPEFLPKLTNKKENMNYNGCQSTVDEVYAIYRQWLQDAIDSDFKSLALPMTGTMYQFKGQGKVTSKWFIDFHYQRAESNDVSN